MILTMECEELFKDYSRTLDFETGEVKVGWKDGGTSYSRRLFVSNPDNISVMSIKADRKNAVSGTVISYHPEETETGAEKETIRASGI